MSISKTFFFHSISLQLNLSKVECHSYDFSCKSIKTPTLITKATQQQIDIVISIILKDTNTLHSDITHLLPTHQHIIQQSEIGLLPPHLDISNNLYSYS